MNPAGCVKYICIAGARGLQWYSYKGSFSVFHRVSGLKGSGCWILETKHVNPNTRISFSV